MRPDRDVIAYHESGHAIAAHELGLTVERITIEREGDAAGHVIHDYGCNMNEIIYEDEAVRQWALERAAITSLAGEVAQRQFKAESIKEEHGGGDRVAVHQILDHLAGECDHELRNAWEQLLVIRTERLIAKRWKCVEYIANFLLKQTTLEGAEDIRHAIADAELPIEHRGKRLSVSDRLALSVGKTLNDTPSSW